MIYVDTSVVLAHVFAEDVQPPAALWQAELVSSRLTDFEAWVRMNAYGRTATHGSALALTLGALSLVELDEQTCARCRAPFPVPVRSLDALHLATADFLRSRGIDIEIATFDVRMREAASALGFRLSF